MTATHAPVEEELESGTRHRVLALVVEDGPITARELAGQLDLTGAAVRRHLQALTEGGAIEAHDGLPHPAGRGRGRPARSYVATDSGRDSFDGVQQSSGYESIALAALNHLRIHGGESAVAGFARDWVKAQEKRYAPQLAKAKPGLLDRIATLATALNDDGYAATSRPVPGTHVMQICQGHCPVQQVAAAHPEICDAETEGFARMLGVHVQRLATLASGGHVCTTSITANLDGPGPTPGIATYHATSSEEIQVRQNEGTR